MISPLGMRNQPSSVDPQRCQPAEIRARSAGVAKPYSTACSAKRNAAPVRPRPGPATPGLAGGVEPVAAGGRDVGEAGGLSPGHQPPPSIRFRAVLAGDPLVQLHPFVEFRDGRVPAHAVEIGVAGGDDASGLGHPPHFPQRGHRVGEVLQDLVGMDDVEAFVLEVQVINVAGHEPGVRRAALRGQRARRGRSTLPSGPARSPPGPTSAAKSQVMLPGRSRRRATNSRGQVREDNAAEFSPCATRGRGRTDSWWPCV